MNPPQASRLAHARDALHRIAESAADLVQGAPTRKLALQGLQMLPHGGRAAHVWIHLAPGPPGNLRVSTELGLRVVLDATSDPHAIVEMPARSDIVVATKLALDTEARAFQAATDALRRANATAPEGHADWVSALVKASLDPRLPAERLVGDPTWNFIFGPMTERGRVGALVDAKTRSVLRLTIP